MRILLYHSRPVPERDVVDGVGLPPRAASFEVL
jgi:hypothetical protein